MTSVNRRVRLLVCTALALPAFALTACGGDSAKVGACIDGKNKVVDCGSSSAAAKLVSDQEKSNAIACVTIGDKPQKEVKVEGHKFCAEKK
jgi:hypothetical protein